MDLLFSVDGHQERLLHKEGVERIVLVSAVAKSLIRQSPRYEGDGGQSKSSIHRGLGATHRAENRHDVIKCRYCGEARTM
jgi:hypothetical protein